MSMHCVTLAELAAFFAQSAPSLRQRRCAADEEVLMRYWTSNRIRHEQWHREMAAYRTAAENRHYRELREWWSERGQVLEEILVSELLSRVIAAVGASMVGTGERQPTEAEINFDTIVRGVYQAHTEATHRAIQIISESTGSPTQDVVRLNRLRHGIERWVDWLIGRVGGDQRATQDYCVDADRANQFRKEVREGIHGNEQDVTTWLMNASMREMLTRRTNAQAFLQHANQKVAEAAIGLFRPELFDDFGVPKSLWLQRLQTEEVTSRPPSFDEPCIERA